MNTHAPFSENDIPILLAKLKLIQDDPRLSLCFLALKQWAQSGDTQFVVALYSGGIILDILRAA